MTNARPLLSGYLHSPSVNGKSITDDITSPPQMTYGSSGKQFLAYVPSIPPYIKSRALVNAFKLPDRHDVSSGI